MNILGSLFINGKKTASIISIPNTLENVSNLASEVNMYKSDHSTVRFSGPNSITFMTESGLGPRIELKLVDSKVVDEPLRKISGCEYYIFTDKHVYIKDKVYSGSIPSSCQWKIFPFVKMDDLVDFTSTNDIEEFFLEQGFAKELLEYTHILAIPDFNEISSTCTLSDLLVKIEDNEYISASGRKGTIPDIDYVDGRIIYLSDYPVFTGEAKNIGYSYNIKSLEKKCKQLQDRLSRYGLEKIESISSAMKAIVSRLRGISNPIQATGIYDDIVAIQLKIRDLQ